MLVTKSGIRVQSFVYRGNERVAMESLTEEEKIKVATELKLRYMNTLFAGKARFYAEGEKK